MKRLFLALPLLALIPACTPQQQTTGMGAATGAVLGAAVTGGKDTTKGAIVGGALGAVAGSLIGQSQSQPGMCLYRDAYGRQFTAAC